MTTSPSVSAAGLFDSGLLVALLQRQLELYHELRDLSSTQSRFIESGHVDDLLSVLAQRQSIITSLTEVSDRIDPYREQLSQVWPRIGAEDQRRITALLEEVQTLVRSILDSDNRDHRSLQRARDGVAAEMRQTVHAGRAVNAYRAPAGIAPAPRFTDQKG